MTAKPYNAIPSGAAPLLSHLERLSPFLNNPDVTEICINKPGQVVTEAGAEWHFYDVPEITQTYCVELARLTATFTSQTISEKSPILSATLPHGERVQVCLAPCVLKGTTSFTIRKASDQRFTLEQYKERGYFDDCRPVSDGIQPWQQELLDLRAAGDFVAFFQLAVAMRQNIILSGSTGSGKTTFMKTLVCLVPQEERLISIENVDELGVYKTHKNTVPLFYSAGGQGTSGVTQKELIEAGLRMKPDRVFLAEITRGDEAFYYLRNVGSGHPGSMTSMHANSAWEARQQLTLFLKESQAGQSLSSADIMRFLNLNVDIIAQVNNVKGVRRLTEIDYDPTRKLHYREGGV